MEALTSKQSKPILLVEILTMVTEKMTKLPSTETSLTQVFLDLDAMRVGTLILCT